MNYINVEKGWLLPQAEPFYSRGAVGRRDCGMSCEKYRCRELLVPGAEVYLQREDNPKRKTKHSLIHVQKGERLINIDSQAPNRIVLGNGCLKAVCFPRIRCFCRKKPLKIPGSIFTLSMERPKVIWR